MFIDQSHTTIAIRIYEDIDTFRKAVNCADAFGLWKPYRKAQANGAMGCISLPSSSGFLEAVHEAVHASRTVAAYMDWNETDDEEEEFLADVISSIADAVMTCLLEAKDCSQCCMKG